MGACSVPECKNRTENGINVRKCPIEAKRREIWVKYLRENNFRREIPNIFFICDIHFTSYYSSEIQRPKKENPNIPKGTWKHGYIVRLS